MTKPQEILYINVVSIIGHVPILRIIHMDKTIQNIEISCYDAVVLARELLDAIPLKKANFDAEI